MKHPKEPIVVNDTGKWHEDDEFWSETAPFMFDPESWDAASEQVDGILKLLNIDAGAAVLDLACGPGRHSLEFARRGFRVTGIDRTRIYLDEARARALKARLDIDFIEADMRHYLRPEHFAATISMFTSFGYFGRKSDNRQVLFNVYRSLVNGGAMIIDIVGREILARKFQARDWQEIEGVLLLEERQVINNWTQMRNRWILIKENDRREFIITHWLYSAAELSALLNEAGFNSVDIYGDLDGAPYDHAARRLVAVAWK